MAAKKSKTMKKQQQKEEVVEDDEVSTTSSTEAEDVANDDDDDGSTSSDGSGESGSGESGSGDSGSEDEMSVDNDEAKNDDNTKEEPSTITNDGNEACTFDLGNLLAFNTHQVNAAELYNQTTTNNNNEWYNNTPTIANTNGSNTTANEAVLLAKAAEGTTQLLRELWKCPVEKKTDVGPLARLPSVDTKLPRALPPPPPKQLSKWEEFALQRGIAPKSKRSRKVFDESTGEWKHLTGSLETKANAGPESWPIMEVKKNDDPMADPWEKLREEKKGRVDKNVEARMRNAERTGVLDRGSANKFGKNAQRLAKQRDIAKEKERKRGLVAPVGVPLDVKRGEQRGKPSTQLALRATQVSTASLGKFDKQREGEPEKKLTTSIHGNKKRKQQLIDGSGGGSGGGGNKSEAQKSADILNRVMSGGSSSKERERDVKKGKYARGETAYDYEYDDGLGASSFRKKKGRAGAGKIRKFTKKRIK